MFKFLSKNQLKLIVAGYRCSSFPTGVLEPEVRPLPQSLSASPGSRWHPDGLWGYGEPDRLRDSSADCSAIRQASFRRKCPLPRRASRTFCWTAKLFSLDGSHVVKLSSILSLCVSLRQTCSVASPKLKLRTSGVASWNENIKIIILTVDCLIILKKFSGARCNKN